MNKVILIGNLGADPESRSTNEGTAVCNFRIATTERWKDKQGEKQEKTEWHSIVAWARLAEVCAQYLKKGSKVCIVGKLQTRKWTDKEGNDKYTTEVVAQEMEMLSSKAESAAPVATEAPAPSAPTDDLPF